MSDAPPSGVFLSYLSEDAEAARRICATLRTAGITACSGHDTSPLLPTRNPRKKASIGECALFMPIISTNTQTRSRAELDLEWDLARQRSLLTTKGRQFILPVCIDETKEEEALVPDAFLAVRWMRLPAGTATAGFVEDVKAMLDGNHLNPSSIPEPNHPAGASLFSESTPPPIPDYALIRKIGQGSYGDVWLARGVTGIYRAIKIVWRARFADAAPFEREFKGLTEFAAFSLSESIQLALLHVGRNDESGFFYYVMELADDASRERIFDPARYSPFTLTELRAQSGRRPAMDCVNYGVGLASVLASLHRRGLVHRDIKPSNIIFVAGVPKLADIGLVTRSNTAGTFVGTDGFVPPEGSGTPGADVFALGKVLYELATGLDRKEYPRLPPHLGRLPDRRLLMALNDVILIACDPSPKQRYRDGAGLLADLLALQAGQRIRSRRRRRVLLPTVTILGLAAAVGLGTWHSLTTINVVAVQPKRAVLDTEQLVREARSLTAGLYTRANLSVAGDLARRATELTPESADAWGVRAFCSACQLHRGWDLSTARKQEVQDLANRALVIDRTQPDAMLALTYLLASQGAYAQCEWTAQEALKRQDDARLHFVLNLAIFEQGRKENAVERAEQTAQRFPRNPLAHYWLASLYGRSGNFKGCATALDDALSIQPFTAALIAKVSLIVERQGDLPSARKVYEQIAKEDRPNDRAVAVGMSLGLHERDARRVRETAALTANSYFTDTVSRGGPKARWLALAHRLEGRTELERQQWEETVDVLRQRRRDHGEAPMDQARLATALVWLGHIEEAAREIKSFEAAAREQLSLDQTDREQLWLDQAECLAIYYAALGDASRAVPYLRETLNQWGRVSYHLLRLDPCWDKLRGQQEFEDFLTESRPRETIP